jgi:hypothetical protein
MPITYLAPGVYVEEVPSAQQPIAGVGTNTVGFIGIVPNEIQVPVPNDSYDAYLAETIARGPGTKEFDDATKQLDRLIDQAKRDDRESKAAADRVAKLEGELREAKTALEAREAEAKPAADGTPPPAPRGRRAEDLRVARERIARVETDLANARRQAESRVDRSRFLLPYRLETVRITVPTLDTKLCTNFTEYTDRFGTYSADDPRFRTHRALTHAVAGFFKNGGTRCFVARIDKVEDMDRALREFESIDEVALIAAPGITGRDNWGKLVAHCETTEDRFAILDCEEDPGVPADRPLEAGAPLPDLGDIVKLMNYGGEQPSESIPDRSKNAAFYFPYIAVFDPAKTIQDRDPARNVYVADRGKTFVPPSGHIAGVYARVDAQRGVHKAPANETVIGATSVKYFVSKRKQELLNPQGVNCIRNINGNINVYGGRTVGGDRNGEWKYINVRRVMLFLKESIDEGTQWVVFEPNDEALWAKIRLNVSQFLTRVWRSGALFGLTASQAFYVKCDAELNPPEVRDAGQVICEVGVAIVRPAEFVIFRVTQWMGPAKS